MVVVGGGERARYATLNMVVAHDIVESGVRYKVHPEQGRQPKIKFSMQSDSGAHKPERQWPQFRSTDDPEAAVKAY